MLRNVRTHISIGCSNCATVQLYHSVEKFAKKSHIYHFAMFNFKVCEFGTKTEIFWDILVDLQTLWNKTFCTQVQGFFCQKGWQKNLGLIRDREKRRGDDEHNVFALNLNHEKMMGKLSKKIRHQTFQECNCSKNKCISTFMKLVYRISIFWKFFEIPHYFQRMQTKVQVF